MDLKRFRILLAEFGAEIEVWPERERAAARHLLIVSDEAALAHRHARQVDDALTRRPPVASHRAVERVLAGLTRVAADSRGHPPAPGFAKLGRPVASLALLASLAVAGFVVGVMDLAPGADPAQLFELFGLFPSSDVATGFGM